MIMRSCGELTFTRWGSVIQREGNACMQLSQVTMVCSSSLLFYSRLSRSMLHHPLDLSAYIVNTRIAVNYTTLVTSEDGDRLEKEAEARSRRSDGRWKLKKATSAYY